MIDFNCPLCAGKVSVQDNYAGGRCRCPYCKQVIQIPATSAASQAPPPIAALVPPAIPRRRPSSDDSATLPFPAAQIDQFLDRRRELLGEQFFRIGELIGYLIGVYGLLVLAFLAVFGALVRPTGRYRAIPDAKAFIIVAFLLVICQYIVGKVRGAGHKTIRSSPSRISSTSVPDCIAVLLLGGALAAIPAGIFYAIEQEEALAIMLGLLTAVLAAVVLLLAASLMLNPRALNVAVGADLSAGAEAMGLVSLLLKFVLRVAPLALGGLIVLMAGTLLRVCQAISVSESSVPLLVFIHASAWPLIEFSLAYLALYIVSMLYHLFIDGYAALFEIRDSARHLRPPGDGK